MYWEYGIHVVWEVCNVYVVYGRSTHQYEDTAWYVKTPRLVMQCSDSNSSDANEVVQ